MTTITSPHRPSYWAAVHSLTLIRRSLRHSARNLDALILSIALPVMLMLLFVYVFGGAITTGGEYVDYVVPGIILLCAGYGASTTAVSVATDMAEGVVDRFRSMPVAGAAVLNGHVVASVLRNLVSTLVVVGVALAVGFRPDASPLAWLGALGMVLLFVTALTWVSVLVGLLAGSAEAASGFTFFVLFLPYLSSAFVPVDSMPGVLQAFAQNQPVTPMIETIRGLLLGTGVGDSAWVALAWFVPLTLLASAAAVRVFRRRAAT